VTPLSLLDIETAAPPAAQLLRAVHASHGRVPNQSRAMANSPALLRGYLDLDAALRDGIFDLDVREQIAIVVATTNNCAYCLSAHSYIAEHVANLTPIEVADARRGSSANPRTSAVLSFAAEVSRTRGGVSDADLAAARAAGLGDEEIAETIGHVAANTLTNLFAKASRVRIDFPLVTPNDDAG
jgi:uncharacterized peroxidase-related enzyme